MAINKARETRREEIFEAAVSLFNRNGYHDTSIDDIAHAAGISKGGIYHHFKSKKELFIELFHEKIESYYKSVTTSVLDKDNLETRLRYMVDQSAEVFEENREVLKFFLEFLAMGTRDAEIRSEVTSFYQNTIKGISRMIPTSFCQTCPKWPITSTLPSGGKPPPWEAPITGRARITIRMRGFLFSKQLHRSVIWSYWMPCLMTVIWPREDSVRRPMTDTHILLRNRNSGSNFKIPIF